MDAIKFLTKNCGLSCGDPDSEISRAWAEIEAMAADAERYRWLKRNGRSDSDILWDYQGEELDRVIDSEIARARR